MEKEEAELMKHVCKLCNKRYPSGKSLGGHMRSHVIANRTKPTPIPIPIPISIPKKALNLDDFEDDEDDEQEDEEDEDELGGDGNGNEGGKNSGYGLRENPKKTWRLVDSTLHHQFQQPHQHQQERERERERERVCKQCGKGFHSLKALCGHMSSHSEKDRNFKGEGDDDDGDDDDDDDDDWSSDSKEHLILTMESHSDTNNNIINNESNSTRLTRSSLSRYRSLTAATVDDSVSPGGGGGGGSGGGGSSSIHSGIDQHEQEEVAMCLMMLSRDSSGVKGCFNFTAESSDNNSVILEGGSSTNHVGILRIKRDNNKMVKLKQVVVAEEEEINVIHNQHFMDNSDSGYFENGAKELESDDSVDGLARNYGFKKPKVEFGSRISADLSFYDEDESRKRRIRGVLGGDFSRFDSPESDENSSKKKMIKQDYYDYANTNHSLKKGSKYECWVCSKTFKTHQALGGHIISHRKNGDNSLDTTTATTTRINHSSGKQNLAAASTAKSVGAGANTSKSKKAKGHKCPYCPKVFKSGQALGGHKRSHMMGAGSGGGIVKLQLEERKTRSERAVLPPPRLREPEQRQPPLIDLNLPAPMEEEGNSQFMAW